MIKDKLNREIREGDIVVRPIFSKLRISKVLRVTEESITLSQHRQQLSNMSWVTTNPNIEEHNDKRTLYLRDLPDLLIIKRADYYL